MDLSRRVPLYGFGFHHHPGWLETVAGVAKREPWGRNFKVLELYLRANFEIAKAQEKVYEEGEGNLAFWRAGNLVNITSDPLWLVYQRNKKDFPTWYFDKVTTGEAPGGHEGSRFASKYDPPEFNRDWLVHFNQWNLQHIMGDSRNQKRLKDVFAHALGGEFNEYLIFRAIYGELQLKRKEEVVSPTWYGGEWQFLMPLLLTQGDRVELTAALQPEPALRRYVVRTLLLPHYAYAHARALVKSRTSFADWMMLSEDELKRASEDEEESS